MGGKWGDQLQRRKRSFFAGRLEEKAWFRRWLEDSERMVRILHLYGPGGMGKSSLLDEWAAIARELEAAFVVLDSRDFPQTPDGFCRKLSAQLQLSTEGEPEGQEDALASCLSRLELLAEIGTVVLAIDTFEEMGGLSDWLRDSFLVELPDRCLVVLAGRYPLSGDWLTPVWKPWIHELALSGFDRGTFTEYVSKFTSLPEAEQLRLYSFSQGHPLTLSMIMSLSAYSTPLEPGGAELRDVLKHVAACWLREVPDSPLHELIEAASLIRVFNQEMLEAMLDRPIPITEFRRLTQLSFVRKSRRGWFIHDLLRGPLSQEFKERQPQNHRELWLRYVRTVNGRLAENPFGPESSLLLLDLVYMLEDSTLRSIFLTETMDHRYYVKSLTGGDRTEAEQYMRDVLLEKKDVLQQFIDPQTHEPYANVMPFSFVEKAYSLLDLEKWAELAEDFVSVIRNEKHEASALFVILPIHRRTLAALREAPISAAFFRTLSPGELADLEVDPSEPAGWFLYHLDSWKDHGPACRSALFQHLMAVLRRGGLLVHSSPLKLHQDVMVSLGFEEVEGAAHKDFGPEFPSRTYRLDLRGAHLNRYLERLLAREASPSELLSKKPKAKQKERSPLPDIRSLTPREAEIAHLVLENLTNLEIAHRLYVSEITVKKHLGSIYEKLQVKGKTQLVQFMLENRAPQ